MQIEVGRLVDEIASFHCMAMRNRGVEEDGRVLGGMLVVVVGMVVVVVAPVEGLS